MNDIDVKLYLPNKIKIGKKNYSINTQTLYQGVHFHVRRKIIRKLKDEIVNQFIKYYDYEMYNLKLPLNIKYKIIHNKKVLDIDNISYIYIKAIHDVLVELNILKDDNSNYINKYSVELKKDTDVINNYLIIEISF